MEIKLSTPSDIYKKIDDELVRIVRSLTSTSSDYDLNQAANITREQLIKLKDDLNEKLHELKNNADWDTFTIAFYGETGAGKSTLIETLRIILAEPTKRSQQEKFRQLRNEYETNEESLQHLQDLIQVADENLVELEQKIKVVTQDYARKYHDFLKHKHETVTSFAAKKQELSVIFQKKEQASAELLETIGELKSHISESKIKASLWQKLLNLFRSIPEEKLLSQALEKLPKLTVELGSAKRSLDTFQLEEERVKCEQTQWLSELETEGMNAKSVLLAQQREAEQHRQIYLQKEVQLEEQLAANKVKLTQYADGKIIGDGRADFTQQTQRYEFTLKNNNFALLDVPGIEGKEGLVLSEIEKAVQTAHAVFYVTNKAAPPQTGDEERKGTLEKIKQHLGAQTEVWAIFNKKVTNPKYTLKSRTLTSEDENESLAALEGKMREQLGEHFQKVISLTALPAFLASTEHLESNSQNAKRRRKFLQDFTETELIEKSQMQAFLNMLSEQLLTDSKGKIHRANFNKAKEVLDGTTNALDVLEKTFTELAENVARNCDSVQQQLKRSFCALQKRLDSQGENLIREFSSNVRKKLYSRIDDDIKNDTFKTLLREMVEKQLKEVNRKLPDILGKEIHKFENEIADILLRFEEHTRELTSASEQLGKTKLTQVSGLKINIDSGVNKLALFSSLIGAVLAPFTGGASLWVAGGAAVTAIVAMSKAAISFFSTSYKMSQQRNSTDDNLRDIEKQLRKGFQESLNKALPEMEKTIKQLEKAISAPVKQAEGSAKLLHNSNTKLKYLSKQIKTSGAT